ncbi:11847_t:CDS:10 [Ambispora gerdemannii]|uniref:11847_t:CDS:1 n=1 Tax=Ambispora gerdemannii TaxID=144530 RepID=A0A9N9CCW5_9GLOM|nr:11847_t:CDS:10 [Ambispora gerdemannii]
MSIAKEKYQAHNAGHTVIAYAESTKNIITGGNDGVIRVFPPCEKGLILTPKSIESYQTGTRWIAVNKGKFAVASEDNSVCLYNIKEKKFENILYRCTLPARCVDFTADGSKIAIASEYEEFGIIKVEMPIHIVNMLNPKEVYHLKENTDSVKAASTGCDGSIRIWDLRHGEARHFQNIFGQIPIAEPDERQFPIAWHPSSKFFVLPGWLNEIVKVTKADGKWKYETIFKDAHTKAICVLQWSHNGKYLATAGLDSQLNVWEVKSQQPSWRYRTETPVTSLVWISNKTIAYADGMGVLRVWNPFGDELSEHESEQEETTLIEDESKEVSDDDASDEEEIKKKFKKTKIDYDEDNKMIEDEYFLDDFVVGDDEEGTSTKLDKSLNEKPQVNVISFDMPKPFHPGATPFRNKQRYLGCNLYGFVSSLDSDTHSTVLVSFVDQTVNRTYHFQDIYSFSMSCIGLHGVLHAAKSSEGNNPVISYKYIGSVADKCEWHMDLPLDEDIIGIALSAKGPIVATEAGFVRFFDNTGIQTEIFHLKSIVCMAAQGDFAIFVNGVEGNLYNVTTRSFIIQTGRLPIDSKSRLTWVGFAQEGYPVIYNSEGLLSILYMVRTPNQCRWVPVLNTKQLPQSRANLITYWPVGLSGNSFRCVICKKGEKYPPYPLPSVDEVILQIPILHLEKTNCQLEEKCVSWIIITKIMRTRIRTDFEYQEAEANGELDSRKEEFRKKTLENDKQVLQLVLTALKENKLERAFSLTTMLGSDKGIDGAIMIAEQRNLLALADRIRLFKDTKKQQEQNQANNVPQQVYSAISTTIRENFQETTKPCNLNHNSISNGSSTYKSSLKRTHHDSSEPEEAPKIPPKHETSSSSPSIFKKKFSEKKAKIAKENPIAKMAHMDPEKMKNLFPPSKSKENPQKSSLTSIAEDDKIPKNKKQSTLFGYNGKKEDKDAKDADNNNQSKITNQHDNEKDNDNSDVYDDTQMDIDHQNSEEKSKSPEDTNNHDDDKALMVCVNPNNNTDKDTTTNSGSGSSSIDPNNMKSSQLDMFKFHGK